MKITKLVAATAASLSLYASVTSAQNKELETIVVQGHRAYLSDFDEQETPQIDTVLDAEILSNAGVLDLNEALDLSASVARQNNFGGLWNAFSIRGFSGDINLPTGFLVNGFNAGRGFGGPRDIVGVESVEVLKGPRAALFGRGEPGGTVNLTTKRPEFEEKGEFQASFGSWDQARVSADWQTTLGENENIGLRLVGFYEDAESFRETVETEKVGFYPSLTWLASDNTTLNYELEYTKQEIPFDRGVAFTEEFGFTPRRTFTGEPGDGPIDTEVIGHQFEIQHQLSNNWSLLAGFGYRETSLEGNATEANFSGRQTLAFDGRTLSRFFRFRDYDSEYSVIRAELAGVFNTGQLRHRLVIGADYDRFENDQFILRQRGGFIGTDPSTDISNLDAEEFFLLDIFDPVFGQFPTPQPDVNDPNTDRQEVLDGVGIYVQDQIDISDNFQIRIGARFDDFEQDLTEFGGETVTTDDSRFSPQVGAVYLINDGISLFASYGEGFRQQTGVNFEGNQLDPNVTESLEFGLKVDVGVFSDNVTGSINLAVFDVDQDNNVVNDTSAAAVATNRSSLLAAAGEARSRGVELDANLHFENDWSLWLSYAYTDAEFTTTNNDRDFTSEVIEAGDQLINSPKNQLNLQVSKAFKVANMSAQAGAGLLYTDERAGFTGFDFTLPSYTTVRFFAELQPSDRFSLRFDVANLFDETFYTNSFADVWVEPGAPRNYRLSASYSF